MKFRKLAAWVIVMMLLLICFTACSGSSQNGGENDLSDYNSGSNNNASDDIIENTEENNTPSHSGVLVSGDYEYRLDDLDNVEILKYIGNSTEVIIPGKIEGKPVTVIEAAFSSYSVNDFNSSITSVTIPDSVITIGSEAFYQCNSLNHITIGNSVTHIRKNAFARTSLRDIVIPDSIISIDRTAFSNMRNASEVPNIIYKENSWNYVGDYMSGNFPREFYDDINN